MKFYFFLLFLSLLGAEAATAQIIIAGTVSDSQKQPIAGASVLIEGTNTETVTQANGQFTLPTTASLPLTLIILFSGYERQSVPVRGNNFRSLSITLNPEAIAPDAVDVVVSARRLPEDSQKASVTVERLNTEQFQQSPAISPFDALQNVKGVDLLTQSLLFKSVNTRGFGSTTNTRFCS